MKKISKQLLLLSTLLTIHLQANAFDFGEALKQVVSQTQPTEVKEMVGATSDDEELAIGRQIAGNLLGAAPLVKDAQLQKYVNQVGRWVAEQSNRPDLPWHFGVLDSESVNAFATPGGYIFVTKGLYRKLNNEAELAGVLGHEIGHVTRKHHMKLLKKSRLLELGTQILGKETGANNDISKLIGSGAEITARSLDKDAEFEADRMAITLSSRAGYDSFGLPSVLQEIGHGSNPDQVSLLFKTHPHPDERLSRLDRAMGDKFDKMNGASLEKRFYRLK